jgi:hypothetical protein
MKVSMVWVMALGLAAGWGCSSSSPHDSGMMAMHCSKCNADMKPDMTMKCKCGNEVQVGDLKVKCPKCSAEVKMSDCTGACPKCGASMSQETCKVKCPKCGGEAEAKAVCCPHCAEEMKK